MLSKEEFYGILESIKDYLKSISEDLRELRYGNIRIERRLSLIERLLLLPETVTSFRIYQYQPPQNGEIKGVFIMPITGIVPGSTGVFTATPLNAAGSPVTLPEGTVPTWTSSDPLAVVTANPDGLGASVAVDASTPQTGSFVLTVAMPDGTGATPVTVPYDQKPVDNTVASFGVTQVS